MMSHTGVCCLKRISQIEDVLEQDVEETIWTYKGKVAPVFN
jgi:hypothetical protein